MTTGPGTQHRHTTAGKQSSYESAHTHAETPQQVTQAELDALAATVAALDVRVKALEDEPVPPEPPPSFGTIQGALDAAVSGATVNVPAGTYRESVTINKPVTLVTTGAVIDGRDASGNLVRSTWLAVNADDVTVKGFGFTQANGTYAVGSIQANTVERFRLDSCDVGFSYVNLNIGAGSDCIVINCSIHDAKHLGVRVAGHSSTQRGLRNTIEGCRIFHNDRVGEPDPGADGGNLKATYQNDLHLIDNEAYDSGKGLWLDADCQNAVISGNRLHDNDTCGLHDETSTGSDIYDNVAWRNGYGQWGTWGWGAGILVAASKNIEVARNTLAWNRQGISFISQNRPDDPGMTGNYSHDNIVAMEQPVAGQDHWGAFWAQDWAGVMYLPASNNRGLNDSFWYPAPENQYARFIWDGYRTMALFQATPPGTGARYMTTAEKDAALTAAGVPLLP